MLSAPSLEVLSEPRVKLFCLGLKYSTGSFRSDLRSQEFPHFLEREASHVDSESNCSLWA